MIKVWEAYPAKMCSRCHEELDLVYEMDEAAIQTLPRVERSCALQRRRRTVTAALLGGEERS